MKYPYIGKGLESGTIALIFKPDHSITIDSKTWATRDGEIENSTNEDFFKNITHEYLVNTYGEVQSPEHAEFIVELAENAGFNCSGGFADGHDKYFYTFDDCLEFTSSGETAGSDGEKKIKIPPPPKADKQELSEWVPEIGDEVQTIMGKGVVKLPPDEHGFYIILINGEYITATIEQMQKPKTPEEDLRDELTESFCAAGYETSKYIDYLISKYNITKKV